VNDVMCVIDKIFFLVDEIVVKINLKLNIIIILINEIINYQLF